MAWEGIKHNPFQYIRNAINNYRFYKNSRREVDDIGNEINPVRSSYGLQSSPGFVRMRTYKQYPSTHDDWTPEEIDRYKRDVNDIYEPYRRDIQYDDRINDRINLDSVLEDSFNNTGRKIIKRDNNEWIPQGNMSYNPDEATPELLQSRQAIDDMKYNDTYKDHFGSYGNIPESEHKESFLDKIKRGIGNLRTRAIDMFGLEGPDSDESSDEGIPTDIGYEPNRELASEYNKGNIGDNSTYYGVPEFERWHPGQSPRPYTQTPIDPNEQKLEEPEEIL
jgi:hypothetical protein